MGADKGYDTVKASLMKGDTSGNGRISRDMLLKVLQKIADPPLPSPALEQFLNDTFPADSIPIAAFLDFIFQRFPGLTGAEDIDLSAIFQCIDKNGNGFLEKQEVLAAASGTDRNLVELCRQIPSLNAFLDVGRWEKAFMDMDTNEDGRISWFEFLRFFAQTGRAAGESRNQEDLIAVFMCIDTNRNGFLEKNEVLAAVNSTENSALKEFCQQVPTLLPLLQLDTWQSAFEALDTNTDGVISWAEFSTFFADYCAPKSPRPT